jgi:hypothetical protein
MTNNALRYNASTATLSVTNIIASNYVLKSQPVITNNLTLPITYTIPGPGQLGYQFFGNNSFPGNTGPSDGTYTGATINIPASTTVRIAFINLPNGVWMIHATSLIFVTTGVVGYFLNISSSATTMEKTSRAANSTNTNAGSLQITTSRVVTVITTPPTNTQTYHLLTSSTQALGTNQLSAPALLAPVLYATRIA